MLEELLGEAWRAAPRRLRAGAVTVGGRRATREREADRRHRELEEQVRRLTETVTVLQSRHEKELKERGDRIAALAAATPAPSVASAREEPGVSGAGSVGSLGSAASVSPISRPASKMRPRVTAAAHLSLDVLPTLRSMSSCPAAHQGL